MVADNLVPIYTGKAHNSSIIVYIVIHTGRRLLYYLFYATYIQRFQIDMDRDCRAYPREEEHIDYLKQCQTKRCRVRDKTITNCYVIINYIRLRWLRESVV